jgi:Pin2-interacting protein X1
MAAKQKAKEEKRASADKRKELTEKEAPANEDGDSQDGSGEEDNDEEDVLAAMVVPGSPPTRVQRKSGKRKSDPANASPSTASPGDGDSTSSSSSKKKRRSKESVEDDPPSESGSQREGESERSTESNGKKRRVKSTEIASADIVTGLDDGTDKPKKRKSGDVPSNGTPERSEKRRSKKLEDGILTETGSSGDSTASPGDSSSGSPGKATRKEKVAAAAVTDPAATASPKKNRIKVSTATET